MNGISIIYDQEGKPAVLTIAIKLIDDERVKELVNELLKQLGYAPTEPDGLATP